MGPGDLVIEMFEVLCERCLATHPFKAEPPERCPSCGGRDAFVGPYVPEARITGRAPVEVTFSPIYAVAYTTSDDD